MKRFCQHCRKEGHWLSECPEMQPSHGSPRVETKPLHNPLNTPVPEHIPHPTTPKRKPIIQALSTQHPDASQIPLPIPITTPHPPELDTALTLIKKLQSQITALQTEITHLKTVTQKSPKLNVTVTQKSTSRHARKRGRPKLMRDVTEQLQRDAARKTQARERAKKYRERKNPPTKS